MNLFRPTRRALIGGLGLSIAAPAIVRAGWLPLVNTGGAGPSPFTWNPADAATGITLASSNRDLTGTSSGNFASVRTTAGKTSGLWYCETVLSGIVISQPSIQLGIANATFPLTAGNYLGNADKSGSYYWVNQASFNSASITVANAISGTQNVANGDLIQLLMDLTTATGKVWLGQNNVWKTTLVTNPWLTFTVGSDTWFFSAMEIKLPGDSSAAIITLPSTITGTVPGGASVINA